MTSSKIVVLEPKNCPNVRRAYRETDENGLMSRLLSVTELIVTALIGVGFCFCIGLVISML